MGKSRVQTQASGAARSAAAGAPYRSATVEINGQKVRVGRRPRVLSESTNPSSHFSKPTFFLRHERLICFERRHTPTRARTGTQTAADRPSVWHVCDTLGTHSRCVGNVKYLLAFLPLTNRFATAAAACCPRNNVAEMLFHEEERANCIKFLLEFCTAERTAMLLPSSLAAPAGSLARHNRTCSKKAGNQSGFCQGDEGRDSTLFFLLRVAGDLL